MSDTIQQVYDSIIKKVNDMCISNQGKGFSFKYQVGKVGSMDSIYSKTLFGNKWKKTRGSQTGINASKNIISKFPQGVSGEIVVDLVSDGRENTSSSIAMVFEVANIMVTVSHDYSAKQYSKVNSAPNDFVKRIEEHHMNVVDAIVKHTTASNFKIELRNGGLYRHNGDYGVYYLTFSEFGLTNLQNISQVHALAQVVVTEAQKRDMKDGLSDKEYKITKENDSIFIECFVIKAAPQLRSW